MKKVFISYILTMICVVNLITVPTVSIQAKGGTSYCETPVVQIDNFIIYQKIMGNGLHYLYRFNVNKGNSTRIISSKEMFRNIMCVGDTLYYTILDDKGTNSYSVLISGKDKKKVCEGTCEYIDENCIIYTNTDAKGNLILYKKNSKSDTITKLKKLNSDSDYVKTIGHTLYFYQYDSKVSTFRLFSLNANEEKVKFVTKDKVKDKEYGSYITSITDVVRLNGNLFYQYGAYEGSGLFWWGTVMMINDKGKKSMVTDEMQEDKFRYDSTYLYSGYSPDQNKYVKYNTKTGKKTKYNMKVNEDQTCEILGSKTLRIDFNNQKKVRIDRFLSGTKDKNLKRNFIQIQLKQNKKYSYAGEIEKVGQYYAIGITTMDFSDFTYGWHGKMIGITWYLADTNGKIVGSFK